MLPLVMLPVIVTLLDDDIAPVVKLPDVMLPLAVKSPDESVVIDENANVFAPLE
jgi:hypothetical protein